MFKSCKSVPQGSPYFLSHVSGSNTTQLGNPPYHEDMLYKLFHAFLQYTGVTDLEFSKRNAPLNRKYEAGVQAYFDIDRADEFL